MQPYFSCMSKKSNLRTQKVSSMYTFYANDLSNGSQWITLTRSRSVAPTILTTFFPVNFDQSSRPTNLGRIESI